MSAEENLKVIRRLYGEVYNQGRVDLVDEIYAEDFYSHPNTISPNGITGSAGLKIFVTTFKQGIPDAFFKIEDEIAVDDKVVTRWTMTGTMTGQLFGFAPTGRSGRVTGITIHRCKNGRTVESWEEADLLGGFAQFLSPSLKEEE